MQNKISLYLGAALALLVLCPPNSTAWAGDMDDQLKNIFLGTGDGSDLGPSWMDEASGEPPKLGPGRQTLRPDTPIDVLYIKGGTILRGHLVPEQFPDHYALASTEGIVYVLPADSVESRTKEPALVNNRTNRSHRLQMGFIFAPVYSGGVCVSLKSACTGSTAAAGVDVAAIPFTGQGRFRITWALSPALELAGGIDLWRPDTKYVVQPAFGFRYYTNVYDPVKFVRSITVHVGIKPAFALKVSTLTGFQFDVARNIGLYAGLGPEIQILPTFVFGLGIGGGVQGRWP